MHEIYRSWEEGERKEKGEEKRQEASRRIKISDNMADTKLKRKGVTRKKGDGKGKEGGEER